MLAPVEIFEADEVSEDIHEHVNSLFSLEENTILNNKLEPLFRLEKLNNVKEVTLKNIPFELIEDDESKGIHINATNSISHNYLIRIFQDLLNINVSSLDYSESLENNILYFLQRKITYLDTIENNLKTKQITSLVDENSLKELFKNDLEFNYTFLNSERNCNKKRDLIIEEAFNGNPKKYFHIFKEKISLESTTLYKQILFLELQKLNYDELVKILIYLTHKSGNAPYKSTDSNGFKNALMLFESKYWSELLIENQSTFYSSIKSIRDKLKKNNYSVDPHGLTPVALPRCAP